MPRTRDTFGVHMNIRPQHAQVLVLPDVPERMRNGLHIPDTAKTPSHESRTGTVKAIGRGRFLDSGAFCEVALKVGERVIYRGFSGTVVELEGVEHVMLDYMECIAVIDS